MCTACYNSCVWVFVYICMCVYLCVWVCACVCVCVCVYDESVCVRAWECAQRVLARSCVLASVSIFPSTVKQATSHLRHRPNQQWRHLCPKFAKKKVERTYAKTWPKTRRYRRSYFFLFLFLQNLKCPVQRWSDCISWQFFFFGLTLKLSEKALGKPALLIVTVKTSLNHFGIWKASSRQIKLFVWGKVVFVKKQKQFHLSRIFSSFAHHHDFFSSIRWKKWFPDILDENWRTSLFM